MTSEFRKQFEATLAVCKRYLTKESRDILDQGLKEIDDLIANQQAKPNVQVISPRNREDLETTKDELS